MNKQISLITCFISLLILSSCSPSDEQLANQLIIDAKIAFNANDNSRSLQLIDSLHSNYPKCVAQRRMADTVEWSIERYQIERSLPHFDSLLQIRQAEFPDLKKRFHYEKEEKYQDIGEFVHSLLRTESNTSRCYLKPYTNENGEFLLMSYYVGGKSKHNMLTAHVGEMTVSTLTADASDIISYENMDQFHETILFHENTVNGIHELIANNYQEKIKIVLSLNGESNKYIYSIFENERKIFFDTYNLALCIKDMKDITEQQNRLNRKLEILNRKLN